MVNEKLLSTRDDFNPFTSALKEAIGLTSSVPCTMRNKQIVRVMYTCPDKEWLFHSVNWDHVWHNDGSSVTTPVYDLIHFNA